MQYRFQAQDLLRVHRNTPHFHAFRLAIQAAMGRRACEGKLPFDFKRTPHHTDLSTCFWPDEYLISPQVHTEVIMRTKSIDGQPAFLQMVACYDIARHRRPPTTTIVDLPDELLGVDNFNPDVRTSTYTGLYWNLTPGETSGNVYDALLLLACAYAQVESPSLMSPSLHPSPTLLAAA